MIAGSPRAGKTTLANALGGLGHRLRGSDELIPLGWSESSLAASLWFDEPGPWICEGATMARALRKWLARVPDATPADLIVCLPIPVVARSPGQHVMAKGCDTVWAQIKPELERRGTRILEAIDR